MKTTTNESFAISQIATWKFVLFISLIALVLTVFSYNQFTTISLPLVNQFIAEYQPGSRLFGRDVHLVSVILIITSGATAIASLLALFADLVTFTAALVLGQVSRYWWGSIFQHLGIAIVCGVIFYLLII